MEGSNRVEPLNKHEEWLKKGLVLVRVGAQNSKKIG